MKSFWTTILISALCLSTGLAQPLLDLKEVKKAPSTLNSDREEGLPLYEPDEGRLYFVRSLYSANIGGESAGQDIWTSLRQGDNWSEAVNSIGRLNNLFNNAVVGIADSGKTLYLNGTYSSKPEYQIGLTKSKFENGRWTRPTAVRIAGFNPKESFYTFYVDEEQGIMLLSFTHHRKSKEDLFVSFKKGTGWSKPQSLGGDINTEGSEFAPYLSEDGKVLYFSSNGHPGKGEVDIYYSRRRDESWKNWTKPINLGDEINSPKFDAYFSLKGTEAFFASNRDGGFADLYIASYEARVQEEIEQPEMTDAKIYEEGQVDLEGVVNAENIDALTSIDIYDDDGNLVETIEPDDDGHFELTDLNSFTEYHMDLKTMDELLGETEVYIVNHDGHRVYLNKNLLTGRFDFETLEEDVKDVQMAEVIDESELVSTHFKANFDYKGLDPESVTMVLSDEFDHVLEEVHLNPDGTFDFKKIQKGHLYSISTLSEEDMTGDLFLLEGDEEKKLDPDILDGELFERAKGELSVADAKRVAELKRIEVGGGLYTENLEGVEAIDVYDNKGKLLRSFEPNEDGEFELAGLDKFSKYSIDLRALDRTNKGAKIFILNEDGEKVYLNRNLLTGKFPFETLEQDVKALALEDITEDPPLITMYFQAEFDTSKVSPEDVQVYLKDEFNDVVEAAEMHADGTFDFKRIREGRLYSMSSPTPEALSGSLYVVDGGLKTPMNTDILTGGYFEKTASGELAVADEERQKELQRLSVEGNVVAENASTIESIDVYDKQGKLYKTFVPNTDGEFELKGLDKFSEYDLDLRAFGESLGDANVYIVNSDGDKIYLNKNLLTGKFPFQTLDEDVDALEIDEMADQSRFVTTHFKAELGSKYKEGEDITVYLNDEFDDLVETAHVNEDGSFDFKKIEEGHLYWISTSNPGALSGKLFLVEDGRDYILNANILKGALFEKFGDGHLGLADEDHHTEVAEAHEAGDEVGFKFKYGSLPAEGSKIELYDEEGHLIDQALTDSEGAFKFTKLGKNTDYSMRFDEGIDMTGGLSLFIVDEEGEERPLAAEILEGESFNSDAMTMEPVLADEEAFKFDESNLPAVGTKVYLEDEEIEEVVDSSYVDSEGNFKFKQLTPRKDYSIKLASAVDNTSGLDFFIVDATGDKIALDAEGKTNDDIIGKVEAETTEEFSFDEESLPPEGTVVYLTDENDQIIDSAEVDEQGDFRLNNLNPDEKYNIKIAEVDETSGLSDFFILDATGEKIEVNEEGSGQEFIGKAKSARTDKYAFDFKNLPAEGSKVLLLDDLGKSRDSALVDENGEFRFSKLAAEEGFFVQLVAEDGSFADMSTFRVENSKGKFVATSFSKHAAEAAAYEELTDKEKLALFDVFRFDERTIPPVGTKMVVTDVHGNKIDSSYVDARGEFYFAKMTGDETYLIDIDESIGLNIDKAIMFHKIVGDERKLFRLGDAFGYRPIDFVEVEETTFDFDKFVIETEEVIPENSLVYLVEQETQSRVDSTEIAEDGSFGFKAMDREKNYSMEFDEESGIELEEVELFSVSEEEDEIVEKVKIEIQEEDEDGRGGFAIQPLELVEPEAVQMDAQIVAKYGLPELFVFAEEPVLDESFIEEENLKMIEDLEEAGQFEYADAVELFLEAQELRELAEASMTDDIVMAEPYDLGTPEDQATGEERDVLAETIFEEEEEEIDPRVGTESDDDDEMIVTAPLEEVPREDFEMNASTSGEETTQGTATTEKVVRPEDSGTSSQSGSETSGTGSSVAENGAGNNSNTSSTADADDRTGSDNTAGSDNTTGSSSSSGGDDRVATSSPDKPTKIAQPVMEDDAPKTKMAAAVMDDSDWRIGDQIMAVEQTERGWDVHFDFNTFLLNQGQIDYLYQVVIPMMKANPDLELTFEGHTDSRGSDEVNYRMAVLRISNVLYHIEMAGIEDTRLKVIPKGESDPIGDNNTAEGRAKNRRVEIIKMD